MVTFFRQFLSKLRLLFCGSSKQQEASAKDYSFDFKKLQKHVCGVEFLGHEQKEFRYIYS